MSSLCCCCQPATNKEPVQLTAQTITTQPKSNGNGVAKKTEDGFEEIDLRTLDGSQKKRTKEEVVVKTASSPVLPTSSDTPRAAPNDDFNITDIVVEQMVEDSEQVMEDAPEIGDDVVQEATEKEVYETLERMKKDKEKKTDSSSSPQEISYSPETEKKLEASEDQKEIENLAPSTDPGSSNTFARVEAHVLEPRSLKNEPNDDFTDEDDNDDEVFVDAPTPAGKLGERDGDEERSLQKEPSEKSLSESVEIEAAKEDETEEKEEELKKGDRMEEEDEGIASENHNGRGPRAGDYSTTDASNSEEEAERDERRSPSSPPTHRPLEANKSTIVNEANYGKSRMYADASDEDSSTSSEDEGNDQTAGHWEKKHVTRLSLSSLGRADVVSKGVDGSSVAVHLKRSDEQTITDDEFSEKLI